MPAPSPPTVPCGSPTRRAFSTCSIGRSTFWRAGLTGRLLRYEPHTNRAQVVLDRLMFGNGVALVLGEEHVLVNETLTARIARYWLSGPKAGQPDIFASALPGYPDNLAYNGRDMF